MPYATGPYATFDALPAPTTTRVHSARGFDFANRVYLFDDDGNPLPMDPTAQRVMLAVSEATSVPPRYSTDQEREARRRDIAAALEGMEKERAIEVTAIIVESKGSGTGREQINFLNQNTAENQTVVTTQG